MLRVDESYIIRHKVLVEGRSQREVALEFGRSRNTVRKYVQAADPEPRRRAGPREAPVRARVKARVAELIDEWRTQVTKKQRITGDLLHAALVGEGIEVGITVVREVFAELRRRQTETAIPLEHRPGDEAQVDFFEVTVDVGGERRKAWKFLMRLMYSGRDFAWIYDRCDQLSLLDGHVRAFEHFGAVPHRIVYDNLRAAVRKVLRSGRDLAPRFKAMCNHYVFEACFARPFHGNDKGGVEARGGAIRRQHLTPIPHAESLDAMSAALLGKVDADAQRRVRCDGRTVAACFDDEVSRMLALPCRPFSVESPRAVTVGRNAIVRLEGASYSVPSSWRCLEIKAFVGVGAVRFECRGESVKAPRLRAGQRLVQHRHYLSEYARKPQAVRQNAAELLAELGEPYGLLWRMLVDAHGPRDAARLMAGVIGAIVKHGEDSLAEAVRDAIASDRLDLLSLAKLEPRPPTNPVPEALAGFVIEEARAADFDRLLIEATHE